MTIFCCLCPEISYDFQLRALRGSGCGYWSRLLRGEFGDVGVGLEQGEVGQRSSRPDGGRSISEPVLVLVAYPSPMASHHYHR